MKLKTLIPLIVVFAVLAGLVVLKQSTKKEPTIVDQVQLDPLVPKDVSKDDVAVLQLYPGGNPDEKVILTRVSKDPEAWRVTTHFNAPASPEKIDEYLDKIVDLKGEPREQVSDDKGFAPYDLGTDKAFHVEGLKEGGKEPIFEVLVGKAPAPNQVFMRPADSKDVYVVDVNLRREAGLYSDDMAAAPKPDSWLKKDVVNIAKDTISKVTIETPDKQFTIAKETKEVPVEEPKVEDKDEKKGTPGEAKAEDKTEDSSKDTAEPAKPKTRSETTWVLAEGGAGREPKQAGIENLAGAFAPLTATDIVDPDKLADWGLVKPAFHCTINVQGKDEAVVIEGGRPDPEGDGYVRVASADSSVVFKLPKWTFEKVFPKGRDIVNLPSLSLGKGTISKIAIAQPEGNITITKAGDGWNIDAPTADLEPQKTTIDAIAGGLASWQPADYADRADGKGLDAPSGTVTFTTDSGESHTIVTGADAAGIAGRYAQLDGGDTVLVMSKSDVDKIFVAPSDLYQHSVLDIDEDGIARVNVSRAEDGFTLARDNGMWTITVNGQTSDANGDAADDLATALSGFQIAKINFGQADLPAEPQTTVQVVMKDGTEHVLRIGAEQNEMYPVAINGKAETFMAKSLDVKELTPASASLMAKKKAPAAEGETMTPTQGAPAEAETSATEGASAPAPAASANAPSPETRAPAETQGAAAPSPDASTTETIEPPASAPAEKPATQQ